MEVGIDRLRCDWSDWRVGILYQRERYGGDIWLCLPVVAVVLFWRRWP